MTQQGYIKDKLRTFFRITGKVTIHVSGVVDVDGNVFATSTASKLPVQFGKVTGVFVCSGGRLSTLEGCPTYVGDNFDCSTNQLTSLEHAPTHVGKMFRCSDNQITSLTHVPAHVTSLNCAKNKLTNLLHAPHTVDLDISCYGNPLVSLEGAPTQVGRTWWLTYDAHLPLLRTLSGQQIEFMNMTHDSGNVAHILNKYMGQGKVGAIKAAAELIKAGYKANARW